MNGKCPSGALLKEWLVMHNNSAYGAMIAVAIQHYSKGRGCVYTFGCGFGSTISGRINSSKPASINKIPYFLATYILKPATIL